MIRVWELAALGLIIGICAIHAHVFSRNRVIGPWFHFVWALVYFIPVGIICGLERSWWLGIALFLIRAVFYNPVLNIMRQKRFFYQGSGTVNPAATNWLYTPTIWILTIVALIITNIFL